MADSDARLIWELYAAALKHEPAERGAYLERACTDPALRAHCRIRARTLEVLASLRGLVLQGCRVEFPDQASVGVGHRRRGILSRVIHLR